MNPIFRKRDWTTLIASVLLYWGVMARTPSLAQQSPKGNVQLFKGETDWLTADWTQDNSKYAATRAQIDRLVRQGQKPAVLEARYRLQGNARYDTQKIFRWAYAAYKKQRVDLHRNALVGIDDAMNRNLRPGAYDWVRLRFLVASSEVISRPSTELAQVGRRLLKLRKNDPEVTFNLVRNLQYSQVLEDRKQAVVLARLNASKHPGDLYWQWMVADSVRFLNEYSGRPMYKRNEECISEYKKTLNMLPLRHPYRQGLIDVIVMLDLNFDQNGKPIRWTGQMYETARKNTQIR